MVNSYQIVYIVYDNASSKRWRGATGFNSLKSAKAYAIALNTSTFTRSRL